MAQYKCGTCGTTAKAATRCCGAAMAPMKKAAARKAPKKTAKRTAKV